MKQHDVFISYKVDDFETAQWVRSVLETNDISCWMAPADIPGGSSYAVEIPMAIQQCKVMVVIMSEHTQDSIWVPKELDSGLNKGKLIMPFMVDNISLRDDFNFYLSNVQRYAAYENKTKAIEKMLREIRAVLHAGEDHEESAPPVPVAVPAPKPRKRFPWMIALLVCLLLAGAAAAYFGGLFGSNQPKLSAESDVPAARPDYRISLFVPEKMTVHDYNANLETLKARFDTLMGGADYQFEPDGEEIHLMLPSSVFEGKTIEHALRGYLSRSMMLYLVDFAQKNAFIRVPRNAIEEVTIQQGSIDGINPSDYDVDTAEYRYLKVVLSEDFAASNPDVFKSWQQPEFTMDFERFPTLYYYSHTIPAGDGKTFYLLDNDFQRSRFAELLVYNLTHEPLTEAFSFQLDLNTQAEWQDPASSSIAGKNQCLPEAVPGSSVTFTYKVTSSSTAGERFDLEAQLKARLDSFGVPYAFGSVNTEDANLYFSVMMQADHMGLPLIKALSISYSFHIYKGNSYTSQSFSGLEMTRDEEGYGFILSVPEKAYDYEQQTAWLKKLGQSALDNDEPIYIGFDPYSDKSLLFTVQRDEMAESGILHITEFYEVDQNAVSPKPFSENTAWIADFVQSFLDNPRLAASISYESQQFNVDPSGEFVGGKELLLERKFDYQLFSAMLGDIGTEYSLSASGEKLCVFLNLPVNENLPEKAPELAKTIYEKLSLDQLPFDTLGIYLIDEDSMTSERARIFFAKDYPLLFSTKEEMPAGEIYTYGIMRNGRLEPYKERFVEKIQSMEFYQNLTSESYSFWTTD